MRLATKARSRHAALASARRACRRKGKSVSAGQSQTVVIVLRPGRNGRLAHISDWEQLAQDAHFSPTDMAKHCAVSLRHLQRFFHDGYHLRLRTWLNEMRLWRALLMLGGEHSVKEIAYDLGFKQCSHFSRQFKEYHGISPSALQGLRRWAVSRVSAEQTPGSGAIQLTLF